MKIGFFAIGIGNFARPDFITEVATLLKELAHAWLEPAAKLWQSPLVSVDFT
jgi:hypothetical protein